MMELVVGLIFGTFIGICLAYAYKEWRTIKSLEEPQLSTWLLLKESMDRYKANLDENIFESDDILRISQGHDSQFFVYDKGDHLIVSIFEHNLKYAMDLSNECKENLMKYISLLCNRNKDLLTNEQKLCTKLYGVFND